MERTVRVGGACCGGCFSQAGQVRRLVQLGVGEAAHTPMSAVRSQAGGDRVVEQGAGAEEGGGYLQSDAWSGGRDGLLRSLE
jgi:hypothetical protein